MQGAVLKMFDILLACHILRGKMAVWMLGERKPNIKGVILPKALQAVLEEVHGQSILNTELKDLTIGKRHDRCDTLRI